MSRIGRLPIAVPAGVEVTLDGQTVSVKGPKGTLQHIVAEPIRVARNDEGELEVTRPDDERESRSLHGLTRTLVSNMVDRRHHGLREEARDRRRRLPRDLQEPRAARVRLGFSATRSS